MNRHGSARPPGFLEPNRPCSSSIPFSVLMEIIAPSAPRQHNLDQRPSTNRHRHQPLVPQVDLTEREPLRVGPKEKLNPLNQLWAYQSTMIDDDAEPDKIYIIQSVSWLLIGLSKRTPASTKILAKSSIG
jgi:hypothetical protein